MPGMKQCQTNPSTSGSVNLVSLSSASNRHSSTFSAASLNTAKLVPNPSNVAPNGYALPGHTSSELSCVVAAWVKKHTPKIWWDQRDDTGVPGEAASQPKSSILTGPRCNSVHQSRPAHLPNAAPGRRRGCGHHHPRPAAAAQ